MAGMGRIGRAGGVSGEGSRGDGVFGEACWERVSPFQGWGFLLCAPGALPRSITLRLFEAGELRIGGAEWDVRWLAGAVSWSLRDGCPDVPGCDVMALMNRLP